MTRTYYLQKQNKFWAVCHISPEGVPETDMLFSRKKDAKDNCLSRNVVCRNKIEGEGAPRRHK